MVGDIREAFEALEQAKNKFEMCGATFEFDIIKAALSANGGEAGWRSGYPIYDGDGGVCHIPLKGNPDYMAVAFNSNGELVDGCGDDIGYGLDDVERWKPIDFNPAPPSVAVPEGW